MFDKPVEVFYNSVCMTARKGIAMRLGLSKIIDCPGQSVSFATSVDLSGRRFGACCPAKEPIRATGTVRNTAGVLVLSGALTARLNGICDRCARPFQRDVEIPLHAILTAEPVNAENEDEGVFALEGDSVDLEDIVRTAFVLNMDTKLLCKPDCRGLCCRCGANLNDGPCGCRPELDPRLAALQQLLKEE